MKKKIYFFVLVLMMLLIPMAVVQGQGEQPPTPPPGGASVDPNPVPLTPEEEKALASKLEQLEKIRSLKALGVSPAEIRERLHSLPDVTPSYPQNMLPDAALMPHNTLLSYDDVGYCVMSLWREPEEETNWCGPGSGMAVLSNWITVPPSGYDAESYMEYLAGRMMSGGGTNINTWRYVVNDVIDQTWYFVGNASSLSSYEEYLKSDIYYSGRPMNNLVDTWRLLGWAEYSCNHYVAAYAYDIPSNYLYYGDSAPDSANGSLTPNPYGFHNTQLDDFYEDMDNYNSGYHYIVW